MIETSQHLYQPVRYRTFDNGWYKTFQEALQNNSQTLTWDSAAVLSLLSFGYVCGDRTLVNEIKRQPWLSEIDTQGKMGLQPIPAHRRLWQSHSKIAANLEVLLKAEALQVCKGRKEIYILLSGGLDSRVAAGIVTSLFREGKLDAKPICVTWGLPASRDVVYGKQLAEILGLEWKYISLEPADLMRNVSLCAEILGALVSPAHIHRMDWFQNVNHEALVLSASYGDMVGRAEFSGSHLLELKYLNPVNSYGLLHPTLLPFASQQLQADLQELHLRSSQKDRYILCEHEMHAHYTRGMLAQSMNLINSYCTVYQMFTHPDVYRYMWSLHPALRSDDVYAALLERLNPRLAHFPWARTNRALKGKTEGADPKLSKNFNEYNLWIAETIYEKLARVVESKKVKATGLFQGDQIQTLCEAVKNKNIDPRYYDGYDIFAWLASFSCFIDWCEILGLEIKTEKTRPNQPNLSSQVELKSPAGNLRSTLRSIPAIYKAVKFTRLNTSRLSSVIRYPPEF